MVGQVGDWQPHPRRGPIAPEFGSPGPCYALPGLTGQKSHDPRSVHGRGPGWAFGIRHGKHKDDCSPGPQYLMKEKLTRSGPDGTPHYSMLGRHPDLAGFKVPGPGAYSPEQAGPTSKYQAPKYSFGYKSKMRSTDSSPAANKYTLPGMLGQTHQSSKKQAPVYSLTGRSKIGSFHEDLQKTPGPGAYDTTGPNKYRVQQPIYSMTGRNTMPGDGTQKPGPGAHSPENVVINKRQANSKTFGIRHSPYTAPLIVDVD